LDALEVSERPGHVAREPREPPDDDSVRLAAVDAIEDAP
jgi:hypothetical protein